MHNFEQNKFSLFQLLTNLPGLVNVTNHLSEIIFANQMTLKLLGFRSEEDILGINPYNYRCSVAKSAEELISQKMVRHLLF